MNLQDFIHTAHESVYRTGPSTIDYSNSLLLYSPGSEKIYKTVQTNNSGYRDEVTQSEIDFLEHLSRPMMSQFPYGVNFVDLGPGTEYSKQEVLFNTLKAFNIDVHKYISVDVNHDMAGKARDFAEEQFPQALCSRLVDSFENLKNYDFNTEEKVQNFFYLGLTFINFHFEDITLIIDDCLRYPGGFFISFEPREYMPKNITQYYGGPMEPFFHKKMSLLGFQSKDYSLRVSDEVKVYAKVLNTENCTHSEIKVGDEILLMMSLRYKLAEITQKLEAKYDCKFYFNGKFVGALLRKK